MGSQKLFDQLSFGIHEKQKIALLGPNGAGKSTLLKILAEQEPPDQGEISPRKNLTMAYVPQEDQFDANVSILEAACQKLIEFGLDPNEVEVQASIQLSIVGFESFDKKISTLSGGWRKRLSLAIAFAKEPELLLLDEPTNHMDWDGILWLEGQLKNFKNAFMIVSHDREFLRNQCEQFMEINRLYKSGYFSIESSYEDFLTKKEDYIKTQQNLQESMSNKARREVEWLRAGVKARTTKSQSRIKDAHQLLNNLQEVKQRNFAARSKVNIEIDSAGKRSKKYIEIKQLDIAYGENKILNRLDLLLGPKTCIGLLGDNASGKTSLLKVIAGVADNFDGSLFRADGLKFVYFDQKRESLDQNINLLEYLGDGADHIQFKGRSIHVASYAAQFLFHSQKMNLPIAKLSGGEQARLLIAKLLLQPADVLVLDEPTNDLDISTIEILEQSLLDFPGLVIVVSHDRYFLKSICQKYLSLDGKGGWNLFADMSQWLKSRNKNEINISAKETKVKKQSSKKVKLSYKEKRQMETIEEDIALAEKELQMAQDNMDKNDNFSDHEVMKALVTSLEEKQARVDELYTFWQNIEEKMNSE